VGDCTLTRQIDFLRKNSYFQYMESPLGRRFDLASPRSETPGTVGSFLSTVWYRVIRDRFGKWPGVERSCRLPFQREQIALVVLSLANGEPFTPVQIQKAMFLASDKVAGAFRTHSRYDFQPYDYGPFDWQVYADIEALAKEGMAQVNQQPGTRWRTYSATEAGIALGQHYAERLSDEQRIVLEKIAKLVRSLSFSELVSAIYKAYPPMRARSVFRD
jgi:uncharacterized protein